MQYFLENLHKIPPLVKKGVFYNCAMNSKIPVMSTYIAIIKIPIALDLVMMPTSLADTFLRHKRINEFKKSHQMDDPARTPPINVIVSFFVASSPPIPKAAKAVKKAMSVKGLVSVRKNPDTKAEREDFASGLLVISCGSAL